MDGTDTPGQERMMVKAALYARISQDDRGLEKGVGRQLEDARQLAEARDWEVVAEFTDNDVSALDGSPRPGYTSLMGAAEAGDFERIVVYQTSRLWRSRSERGPTIDRLGQLRVSVAAVKGPELDLTSAYGRGMAGLLGEFDTMESEVKGERVARAALERAQEGRANGHVAYGWERHYETDSNGRVVGFRDVEKAAEAEIVREIISRLLDGDSLRGIARNLNDRGVDPPLGPRIRNQIERKEQDLRAQSDEAKREKLAKEIDKYRQRLADLSWHHTSVRKLALRPANVGLRVHHGDVIGEAEWPAIVDEDTHERVTALLEAPKGDKTSRLVPANRKWLLTYGDDYTCGPCGSVLRVTKKSSAGKTYVMYVCNESGCVGRSQPKVDGLVDAVAIERLSRPDAAAAFVGDDEAAQEAHQRAEELRERLNGAADDYADGAIDGEQLRRITSKLRPDLEAAEAEARRSRAVTVPDEIEELTTGDTEKVWHGLDVRRQRAVLEVLGMRVVIQPTEQGPGFIPEHVEITWG